MAKQAIKNGTNVNFKNWEGWMPLHLARREGNEAK
jgi:hypothetical protein